MEENETRGGMDAYPPGSIVMRQGPVRQWWRKAAKVVGWTLFVAPPAVLTVGLVAFMVHDNPLMAAVVLGSTACIIGGLWLANVVGEG